MTTGPSLLALARQIMELAARATPGPWTTKKPGRDVDGWPQGTIVAATAPRQGIYANPPGGTSPAADQDFIAACREAAPAIAQALLDAGEEIAALKLSFDNHADSYSLREESYRGMLNERDAEIARLRKALGAVVAAYDKEKHWADEVARVIPQARAALNPTGSDPNPGADGFDPSSL